MTSLYNYFADFTELILAVLEPVMESAEDAFMAILRPHWSDDEIGERCVAFVTAYHAFWACNSRLLHYRNAMSDVLDPRMMRHRINSTQPIIGLLVEQMGADPGNTTSHSVSMATMTMIGIERSITISTDRQLTMLVGLNFQHDDERFIHPGARLLELAIREARMVLAQSERQPGRASG
jgi:AcrR family transcriptional regulator